MNKLQSSIAELSTQFAQAVARAVMATLASSVPAVAAPPATEPAPTGTKPRALANRAPVRWGAPSRKPGRPAKVAATPKSAPPPKAAAPATGAVLRASLPSPATLQLVNAIVEVLAQGPLYSEDLRRELNLSRVELAKPLAEALASGKVIKTGERRKTIYQLA